MTEKSTPLSTSTLYSLSVKCFTSISQRSMGRDSRVTVVSAERTVTSISVAPRGALFIAQGLGRLGAGRAPGGIEGGEHRQEEARDGDLEHVARVDVRRQVADVIDAGRQELRVEHALQEMHDVV